MRGLLLFCLALAGFTASAQDPPVEDFRPLVITGSASVQLPAAHMGKAIEAAWERSFAQEPGARITATDATKGQLQGVARFNFKSTSANSRLATLGVINYQITIQAVNGLCRIRVTDFNHTGNKHAPGGSVDIGRIYDGERPPDPVPGVSRGTATRLHKDMRDQVASRVHTLINTFNARLRQAAEEQ